MKDMEKALQKVKNALNLLTLIIGMALSLTGYSQSEIEDLTFLNDKDYEIINSYYNSNRRILKVYYRTQLEKGWRHYFDDESLSLILDSRGLGSSVTDDELREVLTSEVLKEISNKIMRLTPIRLNQKKMTGVRLVKSYDKPNGVRNGVYISKPIIVGDLAIFRATTSGGSKINILRKVDKKWIQVYAIEEWMFLY